MPSLALVLFLFSYAAMPPRRFPAPWRAREIAGGFAIEDASGQVLAYVYGRDESIAVQAKGLTKDEARRIARGIAKLPEFSTQRRESSGPERV